MSLPKRIFLSVMFLSSLVMAMMKQVCREAVGASTKLILSLLSVLSMSLTTTTGRAAEAKPNVVVFLADDAGWGDYGHSGNRQMATPRIDSIAEGGVSLARFFVCPVCSPTRAEFLTGRWYPRGGVRGVSTLPWILRCQSLP